VVDHPCSAEGCEERPREAGEGVEEDEVEGVEEGGGEEEGDGDEDGGGEGGGEDEGRS